MQNASAVQRASRTARQVSKVMSPRAGGIRRWLVLFVVVLIAIVGADALWGLINSRFEPVAVTIGLGVVQGEPQITARVVGDLHWGFYLHGASADAATCAVSDIAGDLLATIKLENAESVRPGQASAITLAASAKIENYERASKLLTLSVLSGPPTTISFSCSLRLHLRVFSLMPVPLDIHVPASNISIGDYADVARPESDAANASLVSGWAVGRDTESGRLTASHGVFPPQCVPNEHDSYPCLSPCLSLMLSFEALQSTESPLLPATLLACTTSQPLPELTGGLDRRRFRARRDAALPIFMPHAPHSHSVSLAAHACSRPLAPQSHVQDQPAIRRRQR